MRRARRNRVIHLQALNHCAALIAAPDDTSEQDWQPICPHNDT